MSNFCDPHGMKHARLPCPSLTHRAHSNSCSLISGWWCHPTISSSVIPFFSRLWSIPASMSQFFSTGGHSIEASASASVLPMNIQDGFPLGLTGLISMQSKGLSRVFSNTTVQRTYMYVTCQMMSYSLCWDLTTKTEFKQCATMRVKTHCPIYTHLVTRRGSCFTHGTVLNRYHARKGPGSPGRVIKYDHFYLGCNSFVFFGW